jgi:hypothetical protein
MATRTARWLSAGVLAIHLAAGIAALMLLPHGFAIDDIHDWSNTLIPTAASLAVAGTAVAALFSRSVAARLASLLVAAAAAGWLAAIIAGRALFPISMTAGRLAIPALIALALAALAWSVRESRVRLALALVAGAPLGIVVIAAQRAPLPSTRPIGGTLADVSGGTGGAPGGATDGELVVACGTRQLRVNPLLTFQSRSPDRTWTLLAPHAYIGTHRTLARYATTPNGFRAAFSDDGESTLVVEQHDTVLAIDATSSLRAPVYSHLDSFTTIEIPFEATIAFSPTGARRFAIEPAEYPSGLPAQLAYLDPVHTFRVVRARDAEKGPFTELARGRLERAAPLVIELRARADDSDGCRLAFDDWAAQVSTEPSPSAGWGVSQGSIQFFSRGGRALVLLTLADTGPGRGFDSVGHAAGVYRNRVRVEAQR